MSMQPTSKIINFSFRGRLFTYLLHGSRLQKESGGGGGTQKLSDPGAGTHGVKPAVTPEVGAKNSAYDKSAAATAASKGKKGGTQWTLSNKMHGSHSPGARPKKSSNETKGRSLGGATGGGHWLSTAGSLLASHWRFWCV